jgi:hypothetical protein
MAVACGAQANGAGGGSVDAGGANDAGDAGESGTAGDTGSGGDAGPPTCAWAAKNSAATCAAGPCPIVLDEELRCSDTEFAAPGLRVAPAPDATWLATSSTNERIVYRLTSTSQQLEDGVPPGFLRTTMSLALGADGAVHLGADTTAIGQSDAGLTYNGGASYAAFGNGTWASSLVHHNQGRYTPVVDLEVGSDGVPRMWIVSDPPSGYSMATPSAGGTWALASAALPVPTSTGLLYRFTLASDGSVVALAFDGSSQLRALVGSTPRAVGSPASSPVPDYSVTAAPAPATPAGPLFAVAIAHGDGIHVVGESAQAPETEVTVSGAKPATPTCVTPTGTATCSGTCHETSSGMEARAFALAWTDDGVAWLVYVVTTFDQTIAYGPQGDPGGQFCVGNVSQDASTGTLHVVRVALDGSAPKEVLSMPIDRPGNGNAFQPLGDFDDPRFVDARGFAKDLAIGVRTGWFGSNAVRVVRLDTTNL